MFNAIKERILKHSTLSNARLNRNIVEWEVLKARKRMDRKAIYRLLTRKNKDRAIEYI